MRLRATLVVLLLVICCASHGVTLELWHTWPHAAQTVRVLAARYTQQTGVYVRIRVINSPAQVNWTSSSGPDIVGLYRPTRRDVQSLAQAGNLQNVRAEVSKGWYAVLWPGLLYTFDVRGADGDGIYGIPLTGDVQAFIYNRQLFEKAGVGVPQSWRGLMSSAQRLRRIGAVPYAGGFGSDMPPLAAVYEYSYLGSHLLMETYAGLYPYTASQWLAYLRLYSEMRSFGFTDAASAKISNVAAMRALMDGRVAMVFAGTQFEQVRMAYKPSFRSWGVFSAPPDPRARFLPRMPGGVVEGIVVNRRSPRKTYAVAFVRWLTQYAQQLEFADGTSSLPAMSVATNSSQLPPRLRPFAVGMHDEATDLRVYERARVLSTFYSGVRNILAGTSDPRAVARRTQAVKAR